MVFEQKEFTPIKGYENSYFICKETTEVLSLKERKNTVKDTAKILKQVNNSKDPANNYFIVTLVNAEGKRKNTSIHRLMAETFLPNPEKKAHVNHIDGNKLNNILSNLEWATEKENSRHAVNTGLSTYDHCKKSVHQYQLNGKYIQSFTSDSEASASTGIAKQNISKVTLCKRPNAGGYLWSRNKKDFIDPYEGNPIPKSFTVVDKENNVQEYAISAPGLCKKLDLTVSPKYLTATIRSKSFCLVNEYKITRNYYD
jgi:hypothetical protein